MLSSRSRTSVRQSKSRLAETLELGSEILKTLQSDKETIRRLNGTATRLERDMLIESNQTLSKIERKKLFELVFVCLALTAVLCGMFALLVYWLMEKTRDFGL